VDQGAGRGRTASPESPLNSDAGALHGPSQQLDIVEQKWWRRRESNPADRDALGAYRGGIAQKSAIFRGSPAADVRYLAHRAGIP
jgi:hypothetical protein